MPDTTHMEAVLKGFPNDMDFLKFNSNSKILDMIKNNFEGHLKILHLLAIPSF